MHISCIQTTNKIVFHGLNLNISVSGLELVKTATKAKVPFNPELAYDQKRQYYILTVNENLEAGQEYTFVVPYRAGILNRLDGFYRQQYVEKGKTY